MEELVSLVETLSSNNYCLMINEEGKEMYDEDGKLLVYKAADGRRVPVAVPNIEEVRELYGLSINSPEIECTVSREEVSKPGNSVSIPDLENCFVWVEATKKNQHSLKATKLLIKLVGSPKYKTLLNNQKTVKVKVWEKIATELQSNGFKIATNVREAGLKTFQKWRNMERTYWKFIRMKQKEQGEDKRRKKPYFFDDLHGIISRRAVESSQEINAVNNEDENNKEYHDNKEEMDDFPRCKGEPNKSKTSDRFGSGSEAFPRQALSLLINLVGSPKYEESLKEEACQNKTKIWENIYKDMMKEGWRFGTSIREGALLLSAKWGVVNRTILQRRPCGPRTLYTSLFRKALLKEIEKRKARGHSSVMSDPQTVLINTSTRRPKAGEIEPEAIVAFLRVVGSEHYQKLFTTSEGRKVKMWEDIFEELQSQGFEICGSNKREKVTRLFQKWRNMKRAFVKYQIANFKGKEIKKPTYYELMFDIISKEVQNMPKPDSESNEDVEMEAWDEDLQSEFPPDYVVQDHDYGFSRGTNDPVEVELPITKDPEQHLVSGPEPKKRSVQSLLKPTSQSRSYHVLKQLKSLHESSIVMQQQNFSKMVSLIEAQITAQNRLTTVISQYILNHQIPRSSSRNGQR